MAKKKTDGTGSATTPTPPSTAQAAAKRPDPVEPFFNQRSEEDPGMPSVPEGATAAERSKWFTNGMSDFVEGAP